MKSKLFVFYLVVVPLAIIAFTVTNSYSYPKDEPEYNGLCFACHPPNYPSSHHTARGSFDESGPFSHFNINVSTEFVGCDYDTPEGNFAKYRINITGESPNTFGPEGWGVFGNVNGSTSKIAAGYSGEIFDRADPDKYYIVIGVDRHKDEDNPELDGFWIDSQINPGIDVCCLYNCNGMDDDCDKQTDEGTEEVCDFKDNNCDGQIDEGLLKNTYYYDSDGDGLGSKDYPSIEACMPPEDFVSNNDDCNDLDPNIKTFVWHRDFDGDGHGADSDKYPDAIVTGCHRPDKYFTRLALDGINDCDDLDDNIHGDIVWYRDFDNDGYGADSDTYPDDATITECQQPDRYRRYVLGINDCDDEDSNIRTPPVWYRDSDGDNHGADSDTYPLDATRTRCQQPDGYFPESILDGINDCDDNDDTIRTPPVWHRDFDGDGHGARYSQYPNATITRCQQPLSYYRLAGDLERVNIDCEDDNDKSKVCYILKEWDDNLKERNPPTLKKKFDLR
jgi:hypothetical protein